jgi:hypothetical protein
MFDVHEFMMRRPLLFGSKSNGKCWDEKQKRILPVNSHSNPSPQPSPRLAGRGRGLALGTANIIFALVFGLFLGLAILKFGDPVILDQKVDRPASLSDAWSNAWPPHWANWGLLPLALLGLALVLRKPKNPWPRAAAARWLWFLPLFWIGWELVSATHSVDAALTAVALAQLAGCVACYFLGTFLLHDRRATGWLLAGVLGAFAICLVRAVDQRLYEYPATRQFLLEGERSGWTNFSPAMMMEMKRDMAVITTNGVDIANPVMLTKLSKGRVCGTMVYPNALAGVILLLFPVSLVLAFTGTRRFRPSTRRGVIAVTGALGALALFWSGSKAGWLIALALTCAWLFRLNWPVRWKWSCLAFVLIAGLAVFGWRFHNYFANGATSVGARFDYWRAAVQTTGKYPLLGTGPGTFQRPYARLKSPAAEMARLTHNDYLEQFSDSGLPGGMAYVAWIILAMAAVGRGAWYHGDHFRFALFLGLLGWFAQGFTEFGLYIPALAWTAFTLLGGLLAAAGNELDNRPATA